MNRSNLSDEHVMGIGRDNPQIRFSVKPLIWSLAVIFAILTILYSRGIATAQGAGALLDNSNLKIGLSYSQATVTVIRNSDNSEVNLAAESRVFPYISIATPPFFFGESALAFGISVSYSSFTASQEDFPNGESQTAGNQLTVETAAITPALSYYFGRNSATQFLRLFAGQGWGSTNISGNVQFGATSDAENPERATSPSGTTVAVTFGFEYRYRSLSLAFFGGGPKIETENHTITLNDNRTVLAYVIDF